MKQKTDGVFFPGCSFGRIHPYKNSQKARLKSGVEKKRWHLMLVFKRQQTSGQPKVKAFIWKPLEDLDHTKLMLVTVLPMFLWSFKKMCFPICIIISVNSYELFYLKNNLVFPPKIIRRKKKNPSVFLLLTTFLKIRRCIYIFNVVFQLQKKYPNNSTTPSIHPSSIGSDRIGSKQLIAGAQREELMKFLYISQPRGGILLSWETRNHSTFTTLESSRCHKRHLTWRERLTPPFLRLVMWFFGLVFWVESGRLWPPVLNTKEKGGFFFFGGSEGLIAVI